MPDNIALQENIHTDLNKIEMHYHEKFQILYVLNGRSEIIFNRKKMKFAQDQLAFIPPHYKHSTLSDTNVTILELNFDFKKLDSELMTFLNNSNYNQIRLINLNPFEIVDVRRLLRQMLYEQTQENPIRFLSLKNYLEELLILLIEKKEQQTSSDANELRANHLKDYIDTNYFEINSANDFSKHLRISIRHVNSIFKEQYGMTPVEYLHQVRIKRAENSLLGTNQNVTSICFEVGYESLSTFYRRFKKQTNLSPNDYRLKYKEHH